MPLPLRSIFARCALSRVASRLQALQAIVLEGQLRALQPELALRRLERAGDIDPAIDLAAQLRPELGQSRQLDVDLPGELLLQAALAADAVVAEADLQGVEVPLLAAAIGLGLQDGRLATQLALQVAGQRSRLSVSFFISPLLRSGPARVPGSSATQYAGLIAERSSAVSQAMPSANCRFRCPSALPCPATSWICCR